VASEIVINASPLPSPVIVAELKSSESSDPTARFPLFWIITSAKSCTVTEFGIIVITALAASVSLLSMINVP